MKEDTSRPFHFLQNNKNLAILRRLKNVSRLAFSRGLIKYIHKVASVGSQSVSRSYDLADHSQKQYNAIA